MLLAGLGLAALGAVIAGPIGGVIGLAWALS